jgi:hypothetical protein
MRDRAADFGGGVVDTLADRARDVGGLAYEAFTSDPNIGRMTTAEYAQAADRPTPRLDQAAQDLGTIGKAIVTQPVQTGKALVQGEVERARQAMTSPRAAGEYAGSMVDPMRIAAALRKTAPIAELDVYHGTPHRFPATEANPLGELDASKIGTGEGAQAYGHGIYLAESPGVADSYRATLSDNVFTVDGKKLLGPTTKYGHPNPNALRNNLTMPEKMATYALDAAVKTKGQDPAAAAIRHLKKYGKGNSNADAAIALVQQWKNQGANLEAGYLYTLDLPDEMIDRMLDWDKPLSEQGVDLNLFAPTMKASIQSISSSFGTHDVPLYIAADMLKGKTGMQLYKMLVDQHGDKMASKMLKNAGIPGIRYLDAGSRGKDGTGTRNFVVFPGEEKKVKILKRD